MRPIAGIERAEFLLIGGLEKHFLSHLILYDDGILLKFLCTLYSSASCSRSSYHHSMYEGSG